MADMYKSPIFVGAILFLILCLVCFSQLGLASFDDEDPVKATQSKVVPVTKELLTREGEPGPASPTYKMSDTSRFLVKKPYQKVDKEELDRIIRGTPSDLGDDWFFLEEDQGDDSTPEPIEEK